MHPLLAHSALSFFLTLSLSPPLVAPSIVTAQLSGPAAQGANLTHPSFASKHNIKPAAVSPASSLSTAIATAMGATKSGLATSPASPTSAAGGAELPALLADAEAYIDVSYQCRREGLTSVLVVVPLVPAILGSVSFRTVKFCGTFKPKSAGPPPFWSYYTMAVAFSVGLPLLALIFYVSNALGFAPCQRVAVKLGVSDADITGKGIDGEGPQVQEQSESEDVQLDIVSGRGGSRGSNGKYATIGSAGDDTLAEDSESTGVVSFIDTRRDAHAAAASHGGPGGRAAVSAAPAAGPGAAAGAGAAGGSPPRERIPAATFTALPALPRTEADRAAAAEGLNSVSKELAQLLGA